MWQSEPLLVFRMTMAVSMSPALPILGSTRQLALATTSTGSSPSSQRARSKSWIIMSRNRPPETLMYSSGGGPGSRLVMTTSSTSPTSPLRIAAWSARLVGSKRRLKPMATGTRCFFRSARQRLTRLMSRSIGLAHACRGRDEVDMGVGRRRNHDGIDLGISKSHGGIGRRPRADLLRQFGRGLGHGIDDVFDARLRMRRDVTGMQLADAARTEDAESQLVLCH